MKVSKFEQQEAIERLLKLLKPKDIVYCSLKHTSSSGMSRRISFLITEHTDERHMTNPNPHNRIINIDWLIARALGYKQSDKGGLVVQGCGMDMGFWVVYELGSTLWPNGTPDPHGRRNGEPDSNGGYALKHEWL